MVIKKAVLDKKDWVEAFQELKKSQNREFWQSEKSDLEDIINEKYDCFE